MSADPDVELASLLRTRGALLLEALAQHSPPAAEHAAASASYAFALAVELGFNRGRCEVIRELAGLHEVGLIYIPASVLDKREGERDVARQARFDSHYEAGAGLARGAGIAEQACQWLLHQRERFDGSGPQGLAGDQIPIESQLLRAACICHRTLAEPDRNRGIERANLRLGSGAGADLDPRVAAALIAILERAGDQA